MTALAAALFLLHALGLPVRLQTPLDTLLDVGGYRMHLVVYRGTAPVTVVLESGGGASLEAWSGVERELARRTGATVVAYDRAGFGRSELGPADLTPRQQVKQLDHALGRVDAPRDRILVGHSYGGLLTLLHAHLFPGHIRGIVLVDPMNQRFVRATGDFVYSTVPHIEHPTTSKDSAVARMVNTFDRLIDDSDAGDLGLRVPMVIITAGDAWWGKALIDSAWRSSHEAMVRSAPGRRLVVAEGSNHDIPAKRPDTIVEAVRSLRTP